MPGCSLRALKPRGRQSCRLPATGAISSCPGPTHLCRLVIGLCSTAQVPPGTGCIVCTMEKANGYVNQLLQDGALASLCCIVVDELHMVRHSWQGLIHASAMLLHSS